MNVFEDFDADDNDKQMISVVEPEATRTQGRGYILRPNPPVARYFGDYYGNCLHF